MPMDEDELRWQNAHTRHGSLPAFYGPAAAQPMTEMLQVPVMTDSYERDYVYHPESTESIYAPSDYSLDSTSRLISDPHPGSRLSFSGRSNSHNPNNTSNSPQTFEPRTTSLPNHPIPAPLDIPSTTRPSSSSRRQSTPTTTSHLTSPKSPTPTSTTTASRRFTTSLTKVLSPLSSTSNSTKSLSTAASRNDLSTLKLLLQSGCSPNSHDWTGKTALHRAASYGYVDIARTLLWEGADPNACANYSQSSLGSHMYGTTLYGNTISNVTPLHRAAKGGHVEVIRLLLAGGAAVDAQTSYGQTALHFAADAGQNSAVRVLLREGNAKLDLQTSKGRTAVRLAAQGGHEHVMRTIVEERVDRRRRGVEEHVEVKEAVAEVPDDCRAGPSSPEFLREWFVENAGGRKVEVQVKTGDGGVEKWREWEVVSA